MKKEIINNNDHNYIVEEKYKLNPILDRYIFLKSCKKFYSLDTKEKEEYEVLRELGRKSKEFQEFDQSNRHDYFLEWANGIMHPNLSEYHTGLKYIYDKSKDIDELFTEHPDAKHDIIIANHLRSTVNMFRKKTFETYLFLLNRDAHFHKLNDIIPDDFSVSDNKTVNVLRELYPIYYEIFENGSINTDKFINAYNEASFSSITFHDLSPLWSFGYIFDFFELNDFIAVIEEIYDVYLSESNFHEDSTMNDLACAIKINLRS